MKKFILGASAFLFTVGIANAKEVSVVMKSKNPVEWTGNNPMFVAIYKGDLDVVKKLIEYGADVNQETEEFTPLMIAARYNQVSIMELLISKGAKISEENDFEMTALKYAELSGAKEAIALLKNIDK